MLLGLGKDEERKKIAYSLLEESPDCYYVEEAVKHIISHYRNIHLEKRGIKNLEKKYKNTLTDIIIEKYK